MDDWTHVPGSIEWVHVPSGMYVIAEGRQYLMGSPTVGGILRRANTLGMAKLWVEYEWLKQQGKA